MSDLYNANPSQYGGFESPVGTTTNKGYYQDSFNLPYIQGRSILATIPEYQRNPLLLQKDLLIKISEGRMPFMKLLLEDAMSGGYTVPDVRYRMPVEITPLQRLYVDLGVYSTNANGLTKLKIKSNKTKISTAMPGGNPKQVGDIARLEVGQFIILGFSWTEPKRTSAVSGSALVSYGSNGTANAPLMEIAKVISVDYPAGVATIQRHWSGKRTSSITYTTTTIPTFEVIANNGTMATSKVFEKSAFIIPMAKSMQEDEIDVKIKNFSTTFQSGVMQRHALGWGSQRLAETIASNLGLTSPLTTSKRQAIIDYYDHWEWTAIFSEQSESFDPETGFWSGTTDGILSNIPKSHFLAIKGIDYKEAFVAGNSNNFGSFHPLVFNKLLEGKGYMGSQNKVILAGSAFYNDFNAMINFMTQSVPDIKSEWGVYGKRFTTSEGLVVDVVPSDKMTMQGMSQSAIMYDKQYFKRVGLQNYPGADIIEIENENPLKTSGIIHGINSFIDRNPDAHWVLTTVSKTNADGSDNSVAYSEVDPLGTYLE